MFQFYDSWNFCEKPDESKLHHLLFVYLKCSKRRMLSCTGKRDAEEPASTRHEWLLHRVMLGSVRPLASRGLCLWGPYLWNKTRWKIKEKLFVKASRSHTDQVCVWGLFCIFIQYFLDIWYVSLSLESSVIWSFFFLLVFFPNLCSDKFLSWDISILNQPSSSVCEHCM